MTIYLSARNGKSMYILEELMKQLITKDGKTYCITTVPYPPQVIKSMKQAGYKVKEIK